MGNHSRPTIDHVSSADRQHLPAFSTSNQHRYSIAANKPPSFVSDLVSRGIQIDRSVDHLHKSIDLPPLFFAPPSSSHATVAMVDRNQITNDADKSLLTRERRLRDIRLLTQLQNPRRILVNLERTKDLDCIPIHALDRTTLAAGDRFFKTPAMIAHGFGSVGEPVLRSEAEAVCILNPQRCPESARCCYQILEYLPIEITFAHVSLDQRRKPVDHRIGITIRRIACLRRI